MPIPISISIAIAISIPISIAIATGGMAYLYRQPRFHWETLAGARLPHLYCHPTLGFIATDR